MEERPERQIRVAIRAELLGQLHVAGDLAGISQRRLTGLCELYGCGRGVRVAGGDIRAVELDGTYLADLLAPPAEPPPPPPEEHGDAYGPSGDRTTEVTHA